MTRCINETCTPAELESWKAIYRFNPTVSRVLSILSAEIEDHSESRVGALEKELEEARVKASELRSEVAKYREFIKCLAKDVVANGETNRQLMAIVSDWRF